MTRGEKFGLLAEAVALLLIVAGVAAIWMKWGPPAGIIALLSYMLVSKALFGNSRTNED